MGVRLGGVRVDVNGELKFLLNSEKNLGGGGGGGPVREGQGRCERKSEVL